MGKTFLMFVFLGISLSVKAQTDTIPDIHELNEIIIKASNQRVSADSSIYIPSKRQKDSAADAISLLSQMAIPQIDVNPLTKSAKTVTGKDIKIFIDYVAALPQDLEGMIPSDVKKIEYLLYPKDVRFHGAEYVINFIMHKYEWGGYTKLNLNQSFSVYQTNGSIYDKFVFKKMIFDFFADENYASSHHNGSKTMEYFDFLNLMGGGAKNVERISIPVSSKFKGNINNLSFRAIYKSGDTQISNTLSGKIQNNPDDDTENLLSYSYNFYLPSISKSCSSLFNGSLNYNFSISQIISTKLSYYISANYIYGNNTTKYNYTDNSFSIINNAKENSHYGVISPQLTWRIDEHQNFIAYAFGDYQGNFVDYSGNTNYKQDYEIWGVLGGIRYIYRQEKWSAGSQFGWAYVKNKFNTDLVKNDTYPKGNIFASYAPNDKNQIEFFYGFGKNIPSLYMKSQNMLRQDKLMWYTGNPDLSNWWDNLVSISYSWLPNNQWQFNFMSDYYISSNRVVANYYPIGPDGTMLRNYINNGDYRRFRIGISATGKFLNEKLIVKINPIINLQSTTGEYSIIKNLLTSSAQVTWYFGKFYLFSWYNSPNTYPAVTSGNKTHLPSQYQVQLGWSHKNWKINLAALNFLRRNWITSKEYLNGEYYNYEKENYGTSMHQRCEISISYTFNYGKKVQQYNEISGSYGGQSAILK
ncbi:MAG: hypothetical protein J1E99_03805 [Muribaculaceae bacterium]|nr:hypothetical protein [Muribaculaceae bacterium]